MLTSAQLRAAARQPAVTIEPRGTAENDNARYVARAYFDWEESASNAQALGDYLVPQLLAASDRLAYAQGLMAHENERIAALGVDFTDALPALSVGTDINNDGETARHSGAVVAQLVRRVELDAERASYLGGAAYQHVLSFNLITTAATAR